MTRAWPLAALLAAALLAPPAVWAAPAVITFDTADATAIANGVGYFNSSHPGSSIVENGLLYTPLSGSLYLSGGTGHPTNDMEGDGAAGGGVLKIVSAIGDTFTLQSLDLAAYDSRYCANCAAVPAAVTTVIGLLNGAVVATDTFTVPAGGFSGGPNSYTPYTSWTAETPSNLAHVAIDTLEIQLSASNGDLGTGSTYSAWSGVDNIAVDVPEPGGLALFGLSVAGLLSVRRGRRGV